MGRGRADLRMRECEGFCKYAAVACIMQECGSGRDYVRGLCNNAGVAGLL